jgi:exopolysaccharide biosynthesis polyprenyl glycosylphosphotransferase
VIDAKHRLPMNFLQTLDLLLVMVSFALTTVVIVHVQSTFSLAEFLSMRTKIANFLIFAIAILICHLGFRGLGLYVSRRLSNSWEEIRDLLMAATLASACFLVAREVFSVTMISAAFLAVFWTVNSGTLCVSHLLLRSVLGYLRSHGRNLRYILILGSNPRAVAFARKIVNNRELGYRLVGFVDDEWSGLDEFSSSGFTLVCNCAGLADFLRHNVVDEISIHLPLGSFYARSSEVVSLCELHGILMRFKSDVFGLKTARWRAEEFDGEYYVASYSGTASRWPRIVKRLLDVTISSVLLIISFPVFITTAIAIKLTSPGPMFFAQDRIGLNKRRFRIYKFRTMIPNAEKVIGKLETRNEMAGPVFKMRNDPRITPIGRLLRRASIDELPQLLNVLNGDMSLVGPRPLPVRDYRGFNEDWQRRRFSVKPGITCLWQVNGRNSIPFDQWMLLDLQYMDEWSLWLDFKILAKTVPVVLKGSGAA